MSNTANTFQSLQGMLHEAYSDGVGSHNHKDKKPNKNNKFGKINKLVIAKNEKCACQKNKKCECKKS